MCIWNEHREWVITINFVSHQRPKARHETHSHTLIRFCRTLDKREKWINMLAVCGSRSPSLLPLLLLLLLRLLALHFHFMYVISPEKSFSVSGSGECLEWNEIIIYRSSPHKFDLNHHYGWHWTNHIWCGCNKCVPGSGKKNWVHLQWQRPISQNFADSNRPIRNVIADDWWQEIFASRKNRFAQIPKLYCDEISKNWILFFLVSLSAFHVWPDGVCNSIRLFIHIRSCTVHRVPYWISQFDAWCVLCVVCLFTCAWNVYMRTLNTKFYYHWLCCWKYTSEILHDLGLGFSLAYLVYMWIGPVPSLFIVFLDIFHGHSKFASKYVFVPKTDPFALLHTSLHSNWCREWEVNG